MKQDTLEEIVADFKKSYEGILPPESIERGAQWYRNALTSYRNDVLEEVLAALKEIETWPEPQPGAGAELGALAGVGMYMQYDNDRKKHAEQIRHLIKSLKVDIIKR